MANAGDGLVIGPGDTILVDLVTGELSVSPDDDRYGYKKLSAAARADAAARGLSAGYWWATWSDNDWRPVELREAEIEGIEPYLEVWAIGSDYACDLADYDFLSEIEQPRG